MRRALTLIEVIIVIVIMSVLAAIIAPQLYQRTLDAKLNQTTFNLQTIRTAIEKYKADHETPPASLKDLCQAEGEREPYLKEIPPEWLSKSDGVVEIKEPSQIAIPKHRNVGGWIYNATTGEVRLNLGAYSKL